MMRAMDYLQNLLDSYDIPVITAFLLGLLTALSPCPLATNITAIGFIGRDIDDRNRMFLNGVLYTVGRVLSYSVLGAVLIAVIRGGADTFDIQNEISLWGGRLLAPALVVAGLLMLFGDRLPLPRSGIAASGRMERLGGPWGSMVLGMMFALAFCPSSGLLYFGMLIPMSAAESGGILLPAVFAVATGLPVVMAAWVLAYSVAGIGRFYRRMGIVQKWFSRIVAVLFIGVGVYYGYINYL